MTIKSVHLNEHSLPILESVHSKIMTTQQLYDQAKAELFNAEQIKMPYILLSGKYEHLAHLCRVLDHESLQRPDGRIGTRNDGGMGKL